MRTLFPLSLAAAAVLLTACHSRGGYFSSDPELTYGPGVVEFPEPARVYLPEYRRAAAASSIGVTTAAAQMARANQYSQPTLAAPPRHVVSAPPVHVPPPPRHVVSSGSHPPGWDLPPGLQYESGPPPRAPQSGTHTVRVYDHAGPAPLPPPVGGQIGVHAGHPHPGARIGVQTR